MLGRYEVRVPAPAAHGHLPPIVGRSLVQNTLYIRCHLCRLLQLLHIVNDFPFSLWIDQIDISGVHHIVLVWRLEQLKAQLPGVEELPSDEGHMRLLDKIPDELLGAQWSRVLQRAREKGEGINMRFIPFD